MPLADHSLRAPRNTGRTSRLGMATRRTGRRHKPSDLRGTLGHTSVPTQQRRFSDLQRLHCAYGKTGIGCHPQTVIHPLLFGAGQDGNTGIFCIGNQAERPPCLVRYREGVPSHSTPSFYLQLVHFQDRWSVLSLYSTAVRMETVSVLFRQNQGTVRRNHPSESQSSHPPLHEKLSGCRFKSVSTQTGTTGTGHTAVSHGSQHET